MYSDIIYLRLYSISIFLIGFLVFICVSSIAFYGAGRSLQNVPKSLWILFSPKYSARKGCTVIESPCIAGRCCAGSAYSGTDNQDQPPRARHVLLLPTRCHGDLQLSRVLRRGRREGDAVHVDTGRILVGHRNHDDRWLRRHRTCRSLGQACWHAVCDCRGAYHCFACACRRG